MEEMTRQIVKEIEAARSILYDQYDQIDLHMENEALIRASVDLDILILEFYKASGYARR